MATLVYIVGASDMTSAASLDQTIDVRQGFSAYTVAHVRSKADAPRKPVKPTRPTFVKRVRDMIVPSQIVGRQRRSRLCSSPMSLMPY